LKSLNFFETISYSKEDVKRTQKYQVEVKREKLKSKFYSIDEYLKNLEMIAEVGEFNDYYIPRIAQLTQRSNQFNLRTKRYTEQDIDRVRGSKEYIARYFKLKDKFGEHGLISILILKKLEKDSIFIDTLIMSCRVLKRGMEEFIFNKLLKIASKEGYSKIIGEYLPTPKNVLVKNLYKYYGFVKDGNRWFLNIKDYKVKNTFIKEK